ncbi:hypothetical protein GCM10027275_22330 [Rhabdobacter roseus]|uniref:PH domain-containing protein n=1 Tax=Rhabdobacter roseus TaxID=1655419 RepID=A0A840TVL6_9BACT|nr:hypothetical protein [Rhabdobacter roseus]MBB5284168.1 hypothetical protein [Rhabdobacter roseus]
MKEFREEQRLHQWWLWAILLGIAGIWLWDFTSQVWGDRPLNSVGLVFSFLIVAGVILLCYFMRLYTHFTAEGIFVRYFPFVKKLIPWNDIDSAEIITYNFVGYGIRFSLKYGTVYNTSGNQGVWIKNKKGSTLLIGTQQPSRVAEIIEHYKP